ERRLAHAGTRGHDRELAVVQARRFAVEALEPGGNAGDALAAARELGDLLEDAADDGLDALDAARLGRSRDLVDGLLGAVDEFLHLSHVAVPLGRDPLARGNELAHAPFFFDAARVRLDVGDR